MCRKFDFRTKEIGYLNSDLVIHYDVLLPCHNFMTDKIIERFFKTIDAFIGL